MKYAWIENERIRDIAPGEPTQFYHPDVAAFYDTLGPDDAKNGDGWIDGKLIKPEQTVQAAQPAPPRIWTAADIRAGLTLSERVKWDNDSAPEIVTVKTELISPQAIGVTTECLRLLVDAGVIAQASMDKVLA